MAPLLMALLGFANTASNAYKYVHDHWDVIGPVVMNIERFAAGKLPGVKKAEVAFEVLAPMLPEFKSMTPELRQAFDVSVKVAKLTAAAVEAVSATAKPTAPSA